MSIKFQNNQHGHWNAQVSVDDIVLTTGSLIFNAAGILSKQEGFRHIQWPAAYQLLILLEMVKLVYYTLMDNLSY
ncbi:protein of unknown function [Legionella fallonii LLAP-10]|uniref:Uncharacterized protein n=2 Tax=Legionella fallonii TaxID=96230 RepID=A0A098G4U9_9GAMM|nr:protein of unknown function [Legionella fallonii LLAP-10]